MPKEKSKKKRAPQSFTTKILSSINSTQLTGSELMKFAKAVHRMKPEDRDFEGRLVAALRVFKGDHNRVMSVMFRMEALARIISLGRLEGWTKPGDNKGMALTNSVLFNAAGQVPLRMIKNRFEFSHVTLLRKAFQLAKLEKE